MLNSTMEEKMQRKIAEVLLASIPTVSHHAGKACGATMVGLIFTVVYLSCLYGTLTIFGGKHLVPPVLFAWVFVFMILALLTFGSMRAAIGAACSDIKDTQNSAGLKVIVVMPPLILAPPVLQSPTSSFAVVVSPTLHSHVNVLTYGCSYRSCFLGGGYQYCPLYRFRSLQHLGSRRCFPYRSAWPRANAKYSGDRSLDFSVGVGSVRFLVSETGNSEQLFATRDSKLPATSRRGEIPSDVLLHSSVGSNPSGRTRNGRF